jgi:hypothetical protein
LNYVDEAVRRHVRAHWPRNAVEPFVWTIGPIRQTLPDFEVQRVRSNHRGEPWVYVTTGAWDARKPDKHGFEFFLQSPEEDPIHVETLAMVANFHADPKYGVGLGDVIEIGRPWMDESLCDRLLVSLPYPYGPDFEHCVIGDHHIRFLWLLPISASEAQYLRANGQEALERKFEEAGINAVDPRRVSVV